MDVTRYGLGARGIDRIEKTIDAYGSSPVTNVSYPIYDGHGNMVRTLSRSGTGYSLTAERIFGAWGEVRNSGGPLESKGRYCANLGHVQDDESGLIYMRARYYESSTGRFVSEDDRMQGLNWLSYCRNNPVNRVDESGKTDEWTIARSIVGDLTEMFALCSIIVALSKVSLAAKVTAASGLAFIFTWFALPMDNSKPGVGMNPLLRTLIGSSVFGGLLQALAPYYGISAGSGNVAASAIATIGTYAAIIGLFLAMCSLDDDFTDISNLS